PFSQGNSAERTDTTPSVPERARGAETQVKPDEQPPQPEPEERVAKVLPPRDDTGVRRSPQVSRPAPGALGEALRNLERYVQNETFQNPQGGATDPGATIQFDTKGVEFGPWLRRFVAQVRRNWFVPSAAMTFRGRVVLQFNIHKDGTTTDPPSTPPSPVPPKSVPYTAPLITRSSRRIRPSRFPLSTPSRSRSSRSRSTTTN